MSPGCEAPVKKEGRGDDRPLLIFSAQLEPFTPETLDHAQRQRRFRVHKEEPGSGPGTREDAQVV